MTAIPVPAAKRYASTKTSVGRKVVEFQYRSKHKASAPDWDTCFAWYEKEAKAAGWTHVTQNKGKTRVELEVDHDLNYRRART